MYGSYMYIELVTRRRRPDVAWNWDINERRCCYFYSGPPYDSVYILLFFSWGVCPCFWWTADELGVDLDFSLFLSLWMWLWSFRVSERFSPRFTMWTSDIVNASDYNRTLLLIIVMNLMVISRPIKINQRRNWVCLRNFFLSGSVFFFHEALGCCIIHIIIHDAAIN